MLPAVAGDSAKRRGPPSMALRLYDTLTREKRPFRPLKANHVRMYVCGPTVYDYAHIGNARPVIVFDVLFRLLRHLYGPEHVTYVRNITDVDDKIIKAAQDRNVPIDTITKTTAQQYFDDVAALGCLTPTHQPRATDYIVAMTFRPSSVQTCRPATMAVNSAMAAKKRQSENIGQLKEEKACGQPVL